MRAGGGGGVGGGDVAVGVVLAEEDLKQFNMFL